MIQPKFEIDTTLLKSITKGQLKKQTSFALTNSVNQIAFDARKKVQTRLPRWLKLTKRFIPSSLIVNKASRGKHTATVGFLERAGIINLMEEPGVRTPATGRKVISVPTKHVKRSMRGGITKANRPQKLLTKKNIFSGTINGNPGIFKRIKKKVIMLYGYEKKTTYKKKFTKFIPTVELLASLKFSGIFQSQLARAIRTMKR